MKYASVNIEYELILYKDELSYVDLNKHYEKGRIELEYIFHFINDDPNVGLINYIDYSNEFLDYIEKLGCLRVPFSKKEDGINWFGALEDLELERNLNSKIFTYELISKMGYEIEGQKFLNLNEVKNLPANKLIKSPYLSAGSNIFLSHKATPIVGGLFIVEPHLDRLIDINLYYDPIKNIKFPYIGKNNKNFVYSGGVVFKSDQDFEEYLKGLGYYDVFKELEVFWELLLKEISKYELKQPLTFDSFIYSKDNKLFFYPLCEINYRKNMGTFLHSMKKFLPENGIGELFQLSSFNHNFINEFQYNIESRTGIISLAEKNPYMNAFFVSAKNLKHSKTLRYNLQDVLKKFYERKN